MASIESILKLIAEKPGQTAAELADVIEIPPADLQSRVAKHLKSGHVKTGERIVDGGRNLIIYYPSQALIDDIAGGKPLARRSPASPSEPASDDFTFGFFSDGALSIEKGSRTIRLTRGDTAKLIAFLDSINVDLINASA